jgi:hypothetical protein
MAQSIMGGVLDVLATYGRSPAEELGYLVGQLIAFAIILGVPVFALISVIKAFKRRTRGWIIAGCIGGAILAALLLLLISGIIAGFTSASRNATRDTGSAAQQRTETAATAATSATGSSTKFSSRTEAGIAYLRKFGVNPSEQFVLAFHNFENAAGRFLTASTMIDTDSVMDPTHKSEPIVLALQTFERTAEDFISAIHRYKEQASLELTHVNLTPAQKKEFMQGTQRSCDRIEEAGTAGVTAAKSGIDLRNAYDSGDTSDSERQRFVLAWNAYSAAINTVMTRAQETQQQADEIYRTTP